MNYWEVIMFDLYELTPEKFEELCFDYMKLVYDSGQYELYHTQYMHDGGKDIVVKFYDKLHKYKIWAECKLHKDSIGLEEIGKSIVLVLSHRINKIILFSASKIRENTKKEILTVSMNQNLEVEFLDDQILIQRLSDYPDLLKKYFSSYNESSNHLDYEDVQINTFISEYYEDFENQSTNAICYLKNGNLFYIYIHIKNNTFHELSNFNIKMDKDLEGINILEKSNFCNITEISPYSDNLFFFLCEDIDYYRDVVLPNVIISYFENDKYFEITKKLPNLNLSKYLIYGFRGKDYINFLSNQVDKALNLSQRKLPQIIDIRGASGIGKTRMLDEIEKKYLRKSTLIFRYDCGLYFDYDILKYLIFDMLDIPLVKRKVEFTLEEFQKYEKKFEIEKKCKEVLSEFIFKDQSLLNVNLLCESIVELFEYVQIKYKKAILILFDNLQKMSVVTSKLLTQILTYVLSNQIQVTIVLSTNTSIQTKRKNDLEDDLILLSKTKKNQINFFKSDGFSEEDKTLFLMEIFNRKLPSDEFISKLAKFIGNKPIEIITACNYLKNKNIVSCNNDEWFISNHEGLESFFTHPINNYSDILKNNLETIFSLLREDEQFQIKEIFSAIVSFKNRMPSFFVTTANLNVKLINMFIDYKILKYDSLENIFSFYHDLIYLYCMKNAYFNTGMLDEKICNYLINFNLYNKDYYFFFIYLRRRNIEKVKTLGLSIIKKDIENYNYQEAIEIGTILYQDRDVKLDFLYYLECSTFYCYCLSQSGNKELSCKIFYSLVDKVLTHQSALPVERVCEFYRDAVNAHLQCFHFNLAQEIMKTYKKIKNMDKKNYFLILNREGVILLSLNKMEEAKKKFNESLILAEKLSNGKFWTSTTHSDLALLYFYSPNNKMNKQLCIEQFTMAIQDYQKCKDVTRYRSYEILWHKAFINILQQEYNQAFSILNLALNEKHYEVYSSYRLNNLLALTELKLGKVLDAENRLLKIKSMCEVNNYESGIIRICNNLAIINYIRDDLSSAKNYFNIAMRYINSKEISLKLYPILSNQLLFFSINQCEQSKINLIRNLVTESKDYRLITHCSSIASLKQGFTFWNFDGFDYMF